MIVSFFIITICFTGVKCASDVLLSTPETITNINFMTNQKSFIDDESMLWEDRKVPYIVDTVIEKNRTMNDLLTRAMDTISAHSCVAFVRVRNATRCCRHTSYVRVTAERPGCRSPVGREYAGGPTVVNLDPDRCFRKVGHILHELLHALGRNHVTARRDRREYVDIVWENVNEGDKDKFEMIRSEESFELGLPYDYESVMHYHTYAYSKNGNATVVRKIPGVNMGQREKLSDIDVELLRLAYNCHNIPSRMVRTNPGAAHRPWLSSRQTSLQGKI